MRLFEGGILDKITNDEYEKMFQQQTMGGVSTFQMNQIDGENSPENGSDDGNESDASDNDETKVQVGSENRELQAGSKEVDGNAMKKKNKKESNEKELTALSLQMLQGAFYLLILGYLLAFLTFLLEIGQFRVGDRIKIECRAMIFRITQQIHQFRMRINQNFI